MEIHSIPMEYKFFNSCLNQIASWIKLWCSTDFLRGPRKFPRPIIFFFFGIFSLLELLISYFNFTFCYCVSVTHLVLWIGFLWVLFLWGYLFCSIFSLHLKSQFAFPASRKSLISSISLSTLKLPTTCHGNICSHLPSKVFSSFWFYL